LVLGLIFAWTVAFAAPYEDRADWSDLERLGFQWAADPAPDAETAAARVANLLAYKVNVDSAADSAGKTLLMVAVQTENAEFVTALLIQGVDRSPVDAEGQTALDHARAMGNLELVALLEGGAVTASKELRTTRRTVPPEEATKSSPIGLSVVPPASLFQDRDTRITGLSLDLPYGFMAEMYGVQLGLLHNVRGRAVGLQAGGLNGAASFTGLRLGAVNVAGITRGIEVGGMNFSGAMASGDEVGCYGLCVGIYNGYRSGGGVHAGLLNVVGGEGDTMWMVGGLVNSAMTTRGFLLAPINYVARDFVGLELGFINFNNFYFVQTTTDVGGGYTQTTTTSSFTAGASRAVQISAMNFVDDIDGAQLGGMNVALGAIHGAQISALNLANLREERESSGFQFGLMNGTASWRGVQIGGLNGAGDVSGVQVGILNIARELHGVQVGALNIAYKNKLPVMVVVNGG